jgi:tRNA(Ile)-lysidine synthase
VLPVLEEELGPGVAASLARTADLLQQDLVGLDDLADGLFGQLGTRDGGTETGPLRAWPVAVASRALRRVAVGAGCPPTEVTKGHLDALVGLALDPTGRGRELQLPGQVTAYRDGPVLRFRRTGSPAPG